MNLGLTRKQIKELLKMDLTATKTKLMKVNIRLFYIVCTIFLVLSFLGLIINYFLNDFFTRDELGFLNIYLFIPSLVVSFLCAISGIILILKREKYNIVQL